MMKLEKNLALKDLPEYYKSLKLRKFAENIVKYQKFKISVAITKFEHSYSINSARCYFSWGVSYIRTGLKVNKAGSNLYKYIQEALDRHVTPLTPTREEERLIYFKKEKKESSLEAPEYVLSNVKEEDDKSIEKDIRTSNKAIVASEKDENRITEIDENIYGIKKDQSIRIMEEKEIDDFIKTTILLNGKCDYKKIKIFFEEI